MGSQPEPQYGPGRDIPLAEIAKEVAAELGIELEVYSEVCVGFEGLDHEWEETTDITLTSIGDRLDIDFDAEGSTGAPVHLPDREAAVIRLRGIMTDFRP